ncbi:response regulator [Amphibacillus sediminis]|uniref:response regulator n=1 Tax=Amphibacillus sediminis TaxID=360185 RepID=UPI0008302DD1|nr:response regulator [Amphibacillus sediminis]
MYKVMLVDDDYPVLDFLSEVIEWGNLGLELQSMHDNGQDAFLESCDHLPDILITDIGMPKMDGLELTRKLKALDEHLQVIILSCHNEFKYAKQALKLNVQDYLLKESLEPQELSSLLMTIKRKLDQIHQEKKLKHDLQSFASQHNQMRSHHSFHHFVHHSGSGDFVAWCLTNRFRIDRNVELYTPILCVINHYNEQLSKFLTDDLLQFAISNVFQEVITNACDPLAHYFYYEKNQSFIILPVNASIKFDNSQHMIQILMRFQEAVDQALNISLTFVVGERSGKNEMVTQIKAILTNKNYLFYVSPQSIEKIKLTETKEFTDLQIFYNQASNELRKIIVMKNVKLVEPFVDKWFRLIEKNKFDHSIVREWLLKLLLELKNNLKELSHFQTHFKLEGFIKKS